MRGSKTLRHISNWLIVCSSIFLVLGSSKTFALNPRLDISQYAHTSWSARDGYFRGAIISIAQTVDGYLWIGTGFGLLRYDGARFVEWHIPDEANLPRPPFEQLLGTRDGSLWIGGVNGLARLKDGKLTNYPELKGTAVTAITEDHEGTVWIGGSHYPFAQLCSLRSDQMQCVGETAFGDWVDSIYEDRSGSLWVGSSTGLWHWRPGARQLYHNENIAPVVGMATDSNGAMVTAHQREIRIMTSPGLGQAAPWRIGQEPVHGRELLRDRDGGLWIGTVDQGLVHRHEGRQDVFTRIDGLSGDMVRNLFEDREGNIWVATLQGLDRFHNIAIPTITKRQGLPSDEVFAVLATSDNSVWVGTRFGLTQIDQGIVGTALSKKQGLPDNIVETMYKDRKGRLLVTTDIDHGLAFFENGHFIRLTAPGGNVLSMTEDRAGNFWLCDRDLGLIHLTSEGTLVNIVPWSKFIGRIAFSTVADPIRGGIWLGSAHGDLWRTLDGKIVERYGAAEGVPDGQIRDLQVDPDGTVWAATRGGLLRLRGNRIGLLNTKNGLPCDIVHWKSKDKAGAIWLYTECGVVGFANAELAGWSNQPDRKVRVKAFYDNVPNQAINGYYTPYVTQTSSGVLYFGTVGDGVAVIDPRNFSENKLPPPVYVQQASADGKDYSASSNLKLPPRVHDLRIDYTALSFVDPQKVRFRYQLLGQDLTWQNAGVRRQAFYSNLRPGSYRFRVIACNNDGIWNEAGATLAFSIAPAWYQTIWFRVLCLALGTLIVWSIYKLRVRQVARILSARFDDRLAERTRLAREFHDTFLQTIQGSKLVADDALDAPVDSARMQKALNRLSVWLEQAMQEGRAVLNSLRSSTTQTDNLAEALQRATEDGFVPQSMKVEFTLVGEARDIHPIVRDEVYRIGYEAIHNACTHSAASQLHVELAYAHELSLDVRDNGKGIDPDVVSKGKAFHFGLQGMRERAARIGGKLNFSSSLDFGTKVELIVPGSIAFMDRKTAKVTMYARFAHFLGKTKKTRDLN
jgi:signal transduction histidine kinase/ligand-binding sensor domain-containing protein